ncbi:hypothetical protein [Streptomyces sp. NBC_01264]|uniref:hypothetical protein n=1 Tax=Streptomyces sp. NBC_01264 TaxID=2903804 RepID=UPI0022578B8E|nr:hypothetical protein [Streptomyces sp. NBC_01264]MCX4781817.1 hypothetical protein [Streptomyces sp. NBC_01264]
MSRYTRRAEMTAEQRATERREVKRRRYLVERGTPSRSKDVAAVRRHCHSLYYEGGMTSHAMAAQSGVSRDTIMHLIKGYRVVRGERVTVDCLLQSTIDKLWGIRLERPAPRIRSGAHLPPLGTRRRLQALNALGYDCVWMAEELGISAGNLNTLMLGHRGRRFVYAATAQRIASFYEKYQHTDPTEVGRSAWHISTTRSRARKNGYVPPWCWDEETIDDPAAEPEWTGACGTAEGYAIHRREQIPLCRPCRNTQRRRAADAPAEPLAEAAAGSVPAPARRGTGRRPARLPAPAAEPRRRAVAA